MRRPRPAVSLTAHSVSRQVENAFKWSSASRTPEARIVRFWLELELEFWRSSLSFPLLLLNGACESGADDLTAPLRGVRSWAQSLRLMSSCSELGVCQGKEGGAGVGRGVWGARGWVGGEVPLRSRGGAGSAGEKEVR